MASLFERYRPRVWDDVVGQDKAIGILRRLMSGAGLGGRAYWIAGPSGTGKTTIAKLIAAELAGTWGTIEIPPGGLSAEVMRDMERDIWQRSVPDSDGAPTGKVYVVNEAHTLRGATIARLLDLIENLPEHAAILFTTTNEGQDKLFDDYDDTSPLLSRCVLLPMARRDLAKAFAERARMIAQKEGLDGQPIEAYVKLAQKHKNNFRAMLGEIENGGMLE